MESVGGERGVMWCGERKGVVGHTLLCHAGASPWCLHQEVRPSAYSGTAGTHRPARCFVRTLCFTAFTMLGVRAHSQSAHGLPQTPTFFRHRSTLPRHDVAFRASCPTPCPTPFPSMHMRTFLACACVVRCVSVGGCVPQCHKRTHNTTCFPARHADSHSCVSLFWLLPARQCGACAPTPTCWLACRLSVEPARCCSIVASCGGWYQCVRVCAPTGANPLW